MFFFQVLVVNKHKKTCKNTRGIGELVEQRDLLSIYNIVCIFFFNLKHIRYDMHIAGFSPGSSSIEFQVKSLVACYGIGGTQAETRIENI